MSTGLQAILTLLARSSYDAQARREAANSLQTLLVKLQKDLTDVQYSNELDNLSAAISVLVNGGASSSLRAAAIAIGMYTCAHYAWN